jgi:hypothetical protein
VQSRDGAGNLARSRLVFFARFAPWRLHRRA